MKSLVAKALLTVLIAAVYDIFVQGRWRLDVTSATVQEISEALDVGTITSVQLLEKYLRKIEKHDNRGRKLRAVSYLAQHDELVKTARQLDQERLKSGPRSPLHGVPVIIKDMIDVYGMETTGGAHAFQGAIVPDDAPVIEKLRSAGAIIIGKATQTELGALKGNHYSNGWSSIFGYTYSAYIKGGNPCGSSSGSAVAVSAGFAAYSLGTDATGSLICPASYAALYTIKPTVGLVSLAGSMPLPPSLTAIGPMAKSAWDVATILTHLVEDPKTDYTTFLGQKWGNIRIGVPDRGYYFNATALHNNAFDGEEIVTSSYAAIEKIEFLGAHVAHAVEIPSLDELRTTNLMPLLLEVIEYEFKSDFPRWASPLQNTTVKTLQALVNFNDEHPELVYTKDECCQELLVAALKMTMTREEYEIKLRKVRDIGLARGLNAALKSQNLDVLVAPSHGPLALLACAAGAPIASVPLGYLQRNGEPYGLAFIAKPGNEAALFKVMGAFETTFEPRRTPKL